MAIPGDSIVHSTEGVDRSSVGRGVVADVLLWFGVLGGAIAWLLHLLLAYAVAEFGCASAFADNRWLGFSSIAWLELAVSLVTFALAIAASLTAKRNQQHFSGQTEPTRLEPNDARVFLARSGVLASSLFAFIIVVQSLPILYYLREC